MDQKTLIEQARQGDPAAWEALVSQHQEPVFRLAYLKLGDADAAADAAQETMLRAFRGLARFDPARPLRPWLLAIVSNLAANRWRSLSRYRRAVESWLAERQLAAESHAAAVERAVDTGDLWAALRQLPDGQQTVLYLRYFLELSVEETAQALDVAEGTVKSRSSRALAGLRKVITRHYPHLEEGYRDG